MTKILVVGLPRSSTSWVSRCLAHSQDTHYLHEPDNENLHPYAVRAKRVLGRYPILLSTDRAPVAYERLWATAATARGQPGRPLSRLSYWLYKPVRLQNPVHRQAHPEAVPRVAGWRQVQSAVSIALASPANVAACEHLVVKSVHVPLALEWLLSRWTGRIVIVARDPLNTIASWWDLGWRDLLSHHPAAAGDLTKLPGKLKQLMCGQTVPILSSSASELERLSWQFGLLTSAVLTSYRRHAQCVLVRHDDLCREPLPTFQALFDCLALPWTEQAEMFLVKANTAGTNPYGTARLAAKEANRWRERLSTRQVAEIRKGIDGFDLAWER